MSMYFEDFNIGQQFTKGSVTIDKDSAIAFAKEYDPQYFHTDEQAAKNSVFGQLVVSGWQTAAITMRLKAESDLSQVSGGLIGLGLESVKWPQPVYPGDSLRIVITIIDKRFSKSKPGYGVMKYKVETFNQHDALVMAMFTSVLIPCAPTT